MSKASVSMLLILALAIGFAAYAQAPTGTILGTVRDESGALIPSAMITITNKATNEVRYPRNQHGGDLQRACVATRRVRSASRDESRSAQSCGTLS